MIIIPHTELNTTNIRNRHKPMSFFGFVLYVEPNVTKGAWLKNALERFFSEVFFSLESVFHVKVNGIV
jgi:hypothetical protein